MKLCFNGTFYYLVAERWDDPSMGQLANRHGFRLHQEKKVFYTPDPRVAARLREHASTKAEEQLSRSLLTVSPWTSRVPFPPHLTPLPFQVPAAKFSLGRNRSYQYAAPGMGKTIIASLIINGWSASSMVDRFVYVCPPFLVRNVENELNLWAPEIGVEHYDLPQLFGNILLVPSSLLARSDLRDELLRFVYRYKNARSALIIDEAHQFKDWEAERTRKMFGFEDEPGLTSIFDRVVSMSGTAMPNRPMELYPNFSTLAPETIDFMDRDAFGLKFCAGRYDGYGYDFSGASNMKDLAERVQGTYMYRLKKDELKLPPLQEEVFVVADDMKPELMAFESKLLKDYGVEDLVKGKLEEKYQYQEMHLMTYQRLLGLQKVKHTLDWMEDVMENSEDDAIIFARHKDVLQAIYDGLHRKGYFPILINSEIPQSKRHDLVKQFQTAKKRRPLVGSLRCMGIGFNATRANRILHVEPAWTDSENAQGTDRAHRYGQKRSVFAQYMVYQNSVDKRVLDVVLRKRKLSSYL